MAFSNVSSSVLIFASFGFASYEWIPPHDHFGDRESLVSGVLLCRWMLQLAGPVLGDFGLYVWLVPFCQILVAQSNGFFGLFGAISVQLSLSFVMGLRCSYH